MRVFTEEAVHTMDITLCKLESLGTILTHLATMECQEPDLTSLADLGRLIKEQAFFALDVLSEGETTADPLLNIKMEPTLDRAG